MTMYCYSTDEERFWGREASRETAAYIAWTETDADKVWTAEIDEKKASDFFLCNVLNELRERAWDEMGDIAEGWLDTVTAEQRLELDKAVDDAINKWADRHNNHPRFFDIKNIEEHVRGTT